MYTYEPKGVCSKKFTFDIVDGKVRDVKVEQGCHGNLQGISRLVEGMDAEEVVKRLKGIQCRGNTSCPDQLATAIEKAIESQK